MSYKDKGYIGLSEIINDVKFKLIHDFNHIKARIIMQMEERYGRTAKGIEYLKNLFEKEFELLKR